jgi:hypothetical protein
MRRSLIPKISGPRRDSEQIAIAARVPDLVVQATDGLRRNQRSGADWELPPRDSTLQQLHPGLTVCVCRRTSSIASLARVLFAN